MSYLSDREPIPRHERAGTDEEPLDPEAEWAKERRHKRGTDPLVEDEADAAAAEAAQIGGSGGAPPGVDEAERPLAEAGEGEAEGFEQAEQELVEHAAHGDPAPDPSVNPPDPERAEGDQPAADADHVSSSETLDPDDAEPRRRASE